jgi:hypothetical protein
MVARRQRCTVVLGSLSDATTTPVEKNASDWRFVEAPTVEAAESALSLDHDIRVGVWPCNGRLDLSEMEQFSAMR